MRKDEIRSLIKGLLPSVDKVEKYRSRFLDACIEKVLAEMYVELWMINPMLLDGFTKGYSNIAVNSDPQGNYFGYSTLPVPIIPLPDKASGVRRVSTILQGGTKFKPMDFYEAERIFGSDVAVVSSMIGYKVSQGSALPRIDYWNMSNAVRQQGVRADLLIPFSAYADTDIVLIPEIKNKQGESFADRVLRELSVIPPVDLVDDNKDRQQTKG